jgi:hypothetical protein
MKKLPGLRNLPSESQSVVCAGSANLPRAAGGYMKMAVAR